MTNTRNKMKELKAYFAEKLVYWAMCIDTDAVLKINNTIKNGVKFTEPVTETERLTNTIKTLAMNHGWKLKKENEKSNMVSFTKKSDEGKKDFKIDVYYKNCSTMLNFNFTIGTSMDHPRKGKTQLFRKGVCKSQFIEILINPRQHTGRGYYKK